LRNLDITLKEIMVDGAFTTTATNTALEDLADTMHIDGRREPVLQTHPPPALPSHRHGRADQPPSNAATKRNPEANREPTAQRRDASSPTSAFRRLFGRRN
jgi:hypothetical protein